MINETCEKLGIQVPALKAIALTLGVPAQRIYSVAKQPQEGVVYDAKVYNWEAIEKFILRRIGHEGDAYANMEDFLQACKETEAGMAETDGRRRRTGAGKIDLGDGKVIPKRRKELEVDGEFGLKTRPGETLVVIALTDTHIAYQVKGTSELGALSNWTFNQKATDAPAEGEGENTDEGDEPEFTEEPSSNEE